MAAHRKPLYVGNKSGKKYNVKRSEVYGIYNDPRQEFWPGLPPKRHRVAGFENLPGVHSKRFPKYVFDSNGRRTYIFWVQ